MITGRQIRAARGLLEWSAEDLARHADLTRPSISNIEAETVQPQENSLKRIMEVFDRNGIEFLPNEGVCVRQNEIRTFTGKAGFRQFLDHIYETMKVSGGQVYQFTSDGSYLPYADIYADVHIKRIEELGSVRGRVVTHVGDNDFRAPYCDYRWVNKAHKAVAPFYIYGDFVTLSLHEAAYKREIVSLHSKILAERYITQFDMLWDAASIPKRSRHGKQAERKND